MDYVLREEDGTKLLNFLRDYFYKEDAIHGIPEAIREIKDFLEEHSSKCRVEKYHPNSICSVIRLLKSLDQEVLGNFLPVLSYLPTSHQEVAVSCIGAYASLPTQLLRRLCTFCTQDGVKSQVVSPAIEHVILSYTRHGVWDCDLAEFLTHLLIDFSLPPSVASDEEIDVWLNRYKRESMLINFSDQIGSGVVNMPFHAEGLNSLLCIRLVTAFQNKKLDLHKKAAVLRVLARGTQEKKFFTTTLLDATLLDDSHDSTWVDVTDSPTWASWPDNPCAAPWPVEATSHDATLLDDPGLLNDFSHSLIAYFLVIVPLVEGKDVKDNVVQNLLYPLFVILVYSKKLLSEVEKDAPSNPFLDRLCTCCANFAKTPDVNRKPKEFHVGVHYAKEVNIFIKEIRKLTGKNKRKRPT
ncbi:uncharacterized protein LOC141585815 [Silene latifolia]|uniref:uncharacterized protein LOC141585815 n=1 Tax=Silene latifolia TaxID=37657 RepID=UPI003D77C591